MYKKILFFGGQKSGKSRLAEQETLLLAEDKYPYYIATYDNSFDDEEMAKRIEAHKREREGLFITIQEPRELSSNIYEGKTYLIDCMSMWILNTINWSDEAIFKELEKIASIDANIVFVLNDVGSGVIPIDRLSRKYVDRSGIIGQRLAEISNEVYEVKLALKVQLK